MRRAKKNRRVTVLLLIAGVIVLPGFVLAQRTDWRSEVDHVVQLADSLSLHSQYTFHLNKFDRKNRSIRETWHYTLHGQEVIIFEVHYFIDSLEHDEVYYLDNGQLVCMEEYEISNPFTDDDEIVWGTVGFFSGQSLRQRISMGKPDYTKGSFNEWDTYKKFRGRYKELTENRTLMERNNKDAIFAP
ncbi:hypothetical protein [Flavihumibacter fluvii]|uniref:hypothetical protein n=1 Tax=Flavihumibacter fluvii TaxID=2838157 RepID=UPI001BDF01FA|nr:hypothetical protein [Flavihumibacter fluvii]ULQ53013.1 hypothetical protein KJS93_01615 [Flavihumibacter fluvii]